MGRLYKWYKEHHICARCKSEEAVPGRTLCPDCAEKSRADAAKRRAEKHDAVCQQYREWNQRMKAKGLCRCGRPARPGKVQCLECAIKERRRREKRMYARGSMPIGVRKELHICLRCQKPAVEGFCYCEEHLEQQRGYMAKAIEAGMKSQKVAENRMRMRKTML